MIKLEVPFAPYNTRRYGNPWGAVIRFVDNRPVYEFFKGHWDGDVVVLDAEPGAVVAFGQKDLRGRNSRKQLYVVEPDGSLREVTEHEARRWAQLAERESAA